MKKINLKKTIFSLAVICCIQLQLYSQSASQCGTFGTNLNQNSVFCPQAQMQRVVLLTPPTTDPNNPVFPILFSFAGASGNSGNMPIGNWIHGYDFTNFDLNNNPVHNPLYQSNLNLQLNYNTATNNCETATGNLSLWNIRDASAIDNSNYLIFAGQQCGLRVLNPFSAAAILNSSAKIPGTGSEVDLAIDQSIVPSTTAGNDANRVFVLRPITGGFTLSCTRIDRQTGAILDLTTNNFISNQINVTTTIADPTSADIVSLPNNQVAVVFRSSTTESTLRIFDVSTNGVITLSNIQDEIFMGKYSVINYSTISSRIYVATTGTNIPGQDFCIGFEYNPNSTPVFNDTYHLSVGQPQFIGSCHDIEFLPTSCATNDELVVIASDNIGAVGGVAHGIAVYDPSGILVGTANDPGTRDLQLIQSVINNDIIPNLFSAERFGNRLNRWCTGISLPTPDAHFDYCKTRQANPNFYNITITSPVDPTDVFHIVGDALPHNNVDLTFVENFNFQYAVSYEVFREIDNNCGQDCFRETFPANTACNVNTINLPVLTSKPLTEGTELLEKKAESTTMDDLHPIIIFPNPNNGIIHISCSTLQDTETRISIVDLQGRIIKEFVQSTFNPKDTELNIEELANGTYFITVAQNDSKYTEIFIKE